MLAPRHNLPMSPIARDPDQLGGFIRTLEDIFAREGNAVQWEQYFSAITRKSDQPFNGPDFLSISPARSATTWLFEQLRRNSSVCLPQVKETNYFVSEWLDGPFRRFVEGWQPNQSIGDISPNYALLPRRAVKEIHRAFPGMRLICILRHPIERVWSQLLFDLTRKGGPFLMTPSEVSALPEQRLLSLAAYCSLLNRYDAILERWLEFYPPEQLHVDFFDSVSNSPEVLLSRIARFLGVPDRGPAFTGKVNSLRYDLMTMPPKVLAYLQEFYAPQLRSLDSVLRNNFGFGIPESWEIVTTGNLRSFKVVEDYRGYDLYYSRGQFRAVRRDEQKTETSRIQPEFWQAMPTVEELSGEVTLEKLMAWLCENRREVHGPRLLFAHTGHNLVAFQGLIYALPHELGVWNKWQEEDPASVPGVLVGPSPQAVVTMLDHLRTAVEGHGMLETK
jgi:hypothetical protein